MTSYTLLRGYPGQTHEGMTHWLPIPDPTSIEGDGK